MLGNKTAAYSAYVRNLASDALVQKEPIRMIFYFLARRDFFAANAFSTSIWKSDNTFI